MTVIRGLAILFAAYDCLLIPVMVFLRTRGHRIWWIEIGFVLGIDCLLVGRILSILEGRSHWHDAPLTLVAAILLALTSRYVWRHRGSEKVS